MWFLGKKNKKDLAKVGMVGLPLYTPDAPPSAEQRYLRNFNRANICAKMMKALEANGQMDTNRYREFAVEYKQRKLYLEKNREE